LQHCDDVLDVRIEIHISVAEMHALAEPRIGRCPQFMAGAAHQGAHLLPPPARRPGAMRHHEYRHSRTPKFLPRPSQIYRPLEIGKTGGVNAGRKMPTVAPTAAGNSPRLGAYVDYAEGLRSNRLFGRRQEPGAAAEAVALGDLLRRQAPADPALRRPVRVARDTERHRPGTAGA